MTVKCDVCGKTFDSHDGGAVLPGGTALCPKCDHEDDYDYDYTYWKEHWERERKEETKQ